MAASANPNSAATPLFLRACRGEPVDRVPVWLMRQAGRYLPEYRAIREKHPFLQVCRTPELAVEVSLQPWRILGVDAVIVFSDILIPAAAMGMELELGDGGPVLGNRVHDAPSLSRLHDFDPERETRFLCDAIRLLAAELAGRTPVLGFAGAPWTLACYMVEGRSKDGFPSAKQFLYCQPDTFRQLLTLIARNTASYLKAQIAAGASAVQLFDTWAGELTRGDFEAFALPAIRHIVREVKAGFPHVPVVLYTKGTAHLLDSLALSEADVLSIDWRTDLADARKRFGRDRALQGNVDPCLLLGPAAGIEQAVRTAIGKTGGRGHILNLGHGILPMTPVENAQHFVETAKSVQLAVLAD